MKWTAPIVVLVLASMVLSGVFAGGTASGLLGASVPHGSTRSTTAPRLTTSTATIAGAEQSLESGRGPAAGAHLACEPGTAQASISCDQVPSEPGTKYAPSYPPIAPGTTYLASLANDSKDGYVVLFGGYNYSTNRYGNQTWKFQAGTWTNITNPDSPPARDQASMTYDAADGYVLLFGGFTNSGAANDTWKFVGGKWTELHPTSAPSKRYSADMSYDAKDGYVVLFGGQIEGAVAADTWTFVGGQWTQLTPLSSPPGNYGGAMGYDYKDSEVILFGGAGSSGSYLETTWAFSGGVWSELFPSTAPGATEYAMMAYDAKDGYLILFGGVDASGQTWKFAKGAWTELSPTNPPGERYGSAMTYDSIDDYVLMVGGTQCNANFCGDTWTYASNVWADLSRSTYPSYRMNFVLTYDAKDGYVLLFGGIGYDESGNDLYLSDTWSFHNGVWARLTTTTAPGPRAYATMVYDATDGYVVLFGGADGNTGTFVVLNDTWKFVGGKWTNLKLTHAPDPRYDAGMVYDAADGYVLLYGGVVNSAIASDSWKFVGGAWVQLTGAGAPAPFYGEALTYDAADGYVVAFGGIGGIGACNNGVTAYCALHTTWKFLDGTWTNITSLSSKMPPSLDGGVAFYDNSTKDVVLTSGIQYTSGSSSDFQGTWTFSAGSWKELSPLTPPPPVPNGGPGGAVYDVKDGYGLLFGPSVTSSGGAFGDVSQTWMFSSDQWTGISLFYSPPPRYGASMTYDAADGYVLLFGGFDTQYYGDTWSYANGNWSQVLVTSAPPARANASIAYDAADGYVVLFGGEEPHSPTPKVLGDTWKYVGGKWTQLKPSTAPSARFGAAMSFDAADDYTVLFGGCGTYVCASQLADTWKFVGGVWTNLTTKLTGGVSPPGTTDAAMTYDAHDGYVLMFGGYGTAAYLATTWSYLDGKWTDLTGSSAPLGRIHATLVYDSSDGYAVLFGGETNGAFDGDTWTYAAGTWTNITSSLTHAPSVRYLAAATFESANGYVLLYAGYQYLPSTGERSVAGDTWEYRAGSWTQWSVY